jgi:alpha-beta hydrolase superfamily lysophospholipase
MFILRTRIKKEIVCEFLPPSKPGNSHASNKVIILCGGMPAYPGKKDLTEFLSKKGYWVFVPRYRGSWESAGSFLKISPHRDVLDIIDQLPKGFPDLWSGKIYKIKQPEIYLIGSSFGGPAVILASRDARVKKAVALSPVTDWRVETKTEPISKLKHYAQAAFGNGYRFTEKNFNKLKVGKFYNPTHEADSMDGGKLFIFHASDDMVVPARTSIKFADVTGSKLFLLPRGGHLSISNIMAPQFWTKINAFFK